MSRFPATPSRLRAMLMMSALLLAGSASAATPDDDAVPLLLGRTEAGRTISVALSLGSRDPIGAADFVAHVTRPGDPLYRHYLTPETYAAQFGARQEDYDALIAWARGSGLSVGERYTARSVLAVTGSAAAMEQALGTVFNNYRDASGRVFYAADEARLPAEIAGRVSAVIGLSDAAGPVPLVRRMPAGKASAGTGTGPNGGFLAADLRQIYSVPPQPFSTRTETLAVFEQGGFDPNDIATYVKANSLPAVPVRVRNVNGYDGAIGNTGVELEAVLDIDMEIGINPAAREVVVYEDGQDSFQVALLDSLSAMASDNKATSISISYGQNEATQGSAAITAENQVLTQMAAQGQAVFASAGDLGAYGYVRKGKNRNVYNVSDPASQPFVTGVGGTTLFDTRGQYNVEQVWNDITGVASLNLGATGGGISIAWPIPAYQAQVVPSLSGGSSTQRNVPDVAAVGDPVTGVDVYSALNGGWTTVGGTSVAAPIWAGFYSLVNAASKGLGLGAAGFANPSLYHIQAGGYLLFYPTFNDVTIGSNGNASVYGADAPGYYANVAYDDTSGLGSFNGGNAVINLATVPITHTSPPPAPGGLAVSASPTTATITWGASAGAQAYGVDVVYQSTLREGARPVLQKGRKASVTGLQPGTTYLAMVVAISATGTATSSPAYFTTPTGK